MQKTERVLACLRKKGEPLGNEFTSIRSLLSDIAANPDEYVSRIETFDNAILTLNGLVGTLGLNREWFKNIAELQGTLSEHQIHGTIPHFPRLQTLRTISEEMERDTTKHPPGIYAIRHTISTVHGYVRSGEWSFPTTITNNPKQVFSGMVIEGYAELMAQFFNDRRLARTTVLALEEVLLDTYRGSDLLADVLPWMQEEASDFSPGIEKVLHGFSIQRRP